MMQIRSSRSGRSATVAWVWLFVVLLGAVGFLESPQPTAHARSSEITGVWEGQIETPPEPLGLIVRFFDDGGELHGEVDIPQQGAFGLVLHDIQWDAGEVAFAFRDIPAAVSGELSEDGLVIEGVFTQSGMAFPIRLELIPEEEPAGIDDASAVPDSADTALDDDPFEKIRDFIEASMEQWNVPGLAIAVVKDGETVMLEGFGLRDVEAELPVTEHTLFGIGSVTKAFTATLFQMLVEEGHLDWDQPVKESIPRFRLHDRRAEELITPRDFALHRSGLPRHDMIWVFNPDLDVAALIEAADHLQPSADFRTTWQYNNFGYMILGELIEQATGQSWENLVTARLLEPLGMHDAVTSIEAIADRDDFARTYQEDEEEGIKPLPLLGVGQAQSAGGIAANAVDMAKWILFNLEGGRVGDEQLVSTVGLVEMQSPQMMLPGAGFARGDVRFPAYGLGWMVDSYRGYYRVHHGGNTFGFSADVAMVPEEGIGVAVLVNATTALPYMITPYVLDVMLGLEPAAVDPTMLAAQTQMDYSEVITSEAPRRTDTKPSRELQEYAGIYHHPAYGELRIELSEEGGLVGTYYDARFPLEHWHFDQFRAEKLADWIPMPVPFHFETDFSGEVAAVAVGMEMMVDPIRFERQPDPLAKDPDHLRRLTGSYELLGDTLTVTLRGDQAVLTIPGQPPYPLRPITPVLFELIGVPGVTVEFDLDLQGEGLAPRAIFTQAGFTFELVRIEEE